jgi:hypothetical protein
MQPSATFSVETIDGDRFGKLKIPYTQVADWLNFLVAPQYQAEIIAAEQQRGGIDIYFYASEGVYLYLDMRLNRCEAIALCK